MYSVCVHNAAYVTVGGMTIIIIVSPIGIGLISLPVYYTCVCMCIYIVVFGNYYVSTLAECKLLSVLFLWTHSIAAVVTMNSHQYNIPHRDHYIDT